MISYSLFGSCWIEASLRLLLCPWYVIHGLIHALVLGLTICVILLGLLYRWGYVHRLFIYLTERELSSVLNQVPVSIGDVDLSQVWKGRIIGRDVILHSPSRQIWKWDSPCIVRLGTVDISVSLLTVIDLLRPYLMTPPYLIDIYSVHLQDIQCFIERRQPNIFNFHLLDESLDIPLPTATNITTSQDKTPVNNDASLLEKKFITETEDEQSANIILSKLASLTNGNEESKGSLQKAFLSQLKQWQSQLDDTHHSETKNGTILDILLQKSKNQKNGLKVVKDVLKQHVDTILSSNKPPPKKEGFVAPQLDNFRIGRVILEHVHIFTRDILLQSSNSIRKLSFETPTATKNGTNNTSENKINSLKDTTNCIEEQTSVDTSGWQTPLYIEKYCISSAELSPPAFAREDTTGNPVLGLSIDSTINILLKHLLGELAERNAGHVLGNAYSEIHTWMQSTIKNTSDKNTKKSAADVNSNL